LLTRYLSYKLQLALRVLKYSHDRYQFDAYYVLDGSEYNSADGILQWVKSVQEESLSRSTHEERQNIKEKLTGEFLERNVVLLHRFSDLDLLWRLLEELITYMTSLFKVIVASSIPLTLVLPEEKVLPSFTHPPPPPRIQLMSLVHQTGLMCAPFFIYVHIYTYTYMCRWMW
jgi:hypothetical protein